MSLERLENIDSKPLILPLPQHPRLDASIQKSVLTKGEAKAYDQSVARWVEGVQNVLRSALRWPDLDVWRQQLADIQKAQADILSIVSSVSATTPLTTRGDLLTRDTTKNIRLGIGAPNTILWTDGLDPSWKQITPGMIFGGQPLTRVDDTNVTLTLGGNPSKSLLDATSITVGWNGQLSLSRGGTGANLSDPGADRILFWDESANAVTWLQTGSGISIIDTTISATGSGGTVTSVGLSAPGEFSVSGSPVTTSGTLGLAWASQSANRMFASPSGSAGLPSFRAITALDLGTGTADSSTFLRGDLTWNNTLVGVFQADRILTVSGTSAGGNNHWHLYSSNARFSIVLKGVESGADSGSNFAIFSYDDLGVFKSELLLLDRATGRLEITSDTRLLNQSASTLLRVDSNKDIKSVTIGSGLSFDGTTLSATGSGGTVTSVALTMPTGFSVAGSPITGAGTLAVTTALSGILRGTGSAFSTVTIGSGLSYDGTTLSATGSGGTVTSVGLTMPTGFSVSGSPVTTSGTLAVTTSLNGILRGTGSAFSTVTVGSGLSYDGTTLSATTTGEANTASNVGSLGVGHFKQKTSLDLEFYKTLGAEGIAFANVSSDYNQVKLDINGLTEDTAPDQDDDFVATYDASATAHKKVKLGSLFGQFGLLSNYRTKTMTDDADTDLFTVTLANTEDGCGFILEFAIVSVTSNGVAVRTGTWSIEVIKDGTAYDSQYELQDSSGGLSDADISADFTLTGRGTTTGTGSVTIGLGVATSWTPTSNTLYYRVVQLGPATVSFL